MRPVRCLPLLLLAAAAGAVEGPPPFDWTVEGPLAAEREVAASASADAGTGRGYAGGNARESFRARDYLTAPLTVRYGVFDRLEAFLAVPYDWAATDLPGSYVLNGAVEPAAGAASGGDLSDAALGVRWGPGGPAEDGRAFVLGAAVIYPGGWDPWRSAAYNNTGSFGVPRQAFGDGAWKVEVTAEELAAGPTFRWSALAGALLRLPVDAQGGAFGLGYGESLAVREPSVLLARVRAERSPAEGWWAGVRAEGCWADGGAITPGGALAADAAGYAAIVDGYRNLVKAGGGAWLGAGAAWEPGWGAARLDLLAPVAASRSYRYWRAVVSVSFVFKPA